MLPARNLTAPLLIDTGSLRFVVGLNALAAGYDANGNMTLRLKDGARYFLAYDAESRLTLVSGTVSASFAYNGDGQRVTATIGTAAITAYVGGYFEWQGGVGKSYYFAGAQRVAMRTGTEVKFLLGDHLGSTSVTALASGAFDTETRYYPWGGVRWSSGASPTDYMYTGQQEVASIGLYFYNSRFYDAALGRFVSPDSIIPNPGDPVSFDRFSYVRNNPLKYVDPSGHNPKCGPDGVLCDNDKSNDLDFEVLKEDSDIEDWADIPDGYTVEDWRQERSRRVWVWMCSRGGWWGSGCPDTETLIIMLLIGEGSTMSNYLTKGDVKRGTQAMVGLMVFLFEDRDGITPKDLSTFTSFYNPNSDPSGAWTQEDRDVYTQGFDSYSWSTATETVALYWDKGPAYDTTNGRMITRWWDDRENFNYTVVFQLYITIETKTLYFGYPP